MVRVKHRYVIGQVLLEPGNGSGKAEVIQSRDLLAAIREKMQVLYGDVGAGEFGTNMALRYFDGNVENGSKILVLRTPREGEIQTKFAMSSVQSIKHTNVCIRSLATCGSARTARSKLAELLSTAHGRKLSENEGGLKDLDL